MKFKFILENIETSEKTKYRTLKEIVDKLNIPYHQGRSIYLSYTKQYLHPAIKTLCQQYKIYDNPDITNSH